MLEESRAGQSATGPAIGRLRQRQEELLRLMTERTLMRSYQGIGQKWNPTNPGHQKLSKSFANYPANLCEGKHQLCHRISPEIFQQRLKVERMRFSLRRDQQTTQDSPNNWDEGNLDSIQGACVDDSITSTSSISRVKESAISHPPHTGSDPELFQQG